MSTPELGLNRASRVTSVALVRDDEAHEARPTGDFASEGLLDPFRRAEVLLPTETSADLVERGGVHWYGMRLQVGFVPPASISVTEAEIRLTFEAPVRQIGGWLPRDEFSVYQTITSTSRLEASTDVTAAASAMLPALGALPALAEMLPQIKAEYKRSSESHRAPQDSVVRTMSDGERRLVFQLRKDERTNIDPRQFIGQVLFGVSAETDVSRPLELLTLEVSCTCGPFRLNRTVQQRVAVAFRQAADAPAEPAAADL